MKPLHCDVCNRTGVQYLTFGIMYCTPCRFMVQGWLADHGFLGKHYDNEYVIHPFFDAWCCDTKQE